jgi:hypothetical protein
MSLMRSHGGSFYGSKATASGSDVLSLPQIIHLNSIIMPKNMRNLMVNSMDH